MADRNVLLSPGSRQGCKKIMQEMQCKLEGLGGLQHRQRVCWHTGLTVSGAEAWRGGCTRDRKNRLKF